MQNFLDLEKPLLDIQAKIEECIDRDEERERMKLLASTEDDVEVIEEQKQKLIMDFGLGAKQPERVNIEVLRDMITESPETMAVAARRWLKNEDAD